VPPPLADTSIPLVAAPDSVDAVAMRSGRFNAGRTTFSENPLLTLDSDG
jgi:hypothetical protein